MNFIMRSVLSITVLVMAAGLGPAAAGEARAVYQCGIKSNNDSGFLPSRAVFEIFPDRKAALVYGRFMELNDNTPIEAEYKVRKNGQIRFKWELTLDTYSGVKYNTRYFIDFDQSKMTGRIKGNVSGAPTGRIGGLLKCRRT